MIRERTKEFTWRVARRDGTFGQEVRFAVSQADAEYLDAEWDDIQRMPPGVERALRVRALATTLDLFALFGGEFVTEAA